MLGWTPAADALHWQIESEIFLRPLDGSEMRLLLTLPERLFGCAHRRGSTDAGFICFQREDNSDLWLLENLAP